MGICVCICITAIIIAAIMAACYYMEHVKDLNENLVMDILDRLNNCESNIDTLFAKLQVLDFDDEETAVQIMTMERLWIDNIGEKEYEKVEKEVKSVVGEASKKDI